MNKYKIAIISVILASFAVGAYFYPQMPERVASHWNYQGMVDGYISRFWGLFLMPLISVVMYLFYLFIPQIDPLKDNIKKFKKYFDNFMLIMFLFLFYLYLLTIIWNLGLTYNMAQVLSPAFGILIYYSGILIEKAKRNWFIGIRTPWTISNEKVWDETHKLGAIMFKISGVVACFGLLFPGVAFFLTIFPIVFSSFYTTVYSYLQYKKYTSIKAV